jgi:aldehyde dehydrogenase (NAD+)
MSDATSADNRTMVPHIVVNARPDFAVCQQECFAPIAAVLPFDSWNDALNQDEKCAFALGASIFTSDWNQAQEFAARLRTGNVSINDVIAPTAHPATPFGGTGNSGWGVTQGAEGLLAMTRPQVVSSRGGTFRPHYDGIDDSMTSLLTQLLRLSHAGRLTTRLRAGLGSVQAMWSVGRSDRKA